MKIRCDRNELFERLQSIAGIVSTGPTTRPILQHCLLEAIDQEVCVAVTDLDISSRLLIERVEVEEPGQLALPAAKFLALIREIPAATVFIESTPDGQGAVLQAESYEFRLLGENPGEFPRIRQFSADAALAIPRDTLAMTLRRVAVAASRDSSRFQLTGVFFEIDGERLTLTATDGKRLTHDWIRIKNLSDQKVSAIVPNRAVDVLLRVLARGSETVGLVIDDTEIQVSFDYGQVQAKLVEGAFPDYRSAMPSEVKTKMQAHKSDLLAAAKSASLVTNKDTSTVLFDFQEGSVRLEAQASDIGESRIEVPVELQGDPLQIRFNPVYFIDALRILPDEEIRMEFCGQEKPGTIRGSDNYRHFLMPLVVG